MKFYTDQEMKTLHPEIIVLLAELRARRNFNAEEYVKAKVHIINTYFHKAGLQSAVVAVSGGIDSAVVLSLVARAQKESDGPIKRIVPLTLPVFKSTYTTGQESATSRAKEVIEHNNLTPIVYDLTKAYEVLKQTIDTAFGTVGEPWAAGQLVSYLRTPANYYTTSLLTQLNQGGLLCGTTNRDEGAYLGYVGKASDGIVDIQIISDLHKSEVRAVAKVLSVPQSILDVTPTGDMYDGRPDEEVFGAPYDFVELYLLLKSLDEPKDAQELIDNLGKEARTQFDHLSEKIDNLHKYNSHKYLVGSPAVHLDVLESGVPRGWTYGYQKVSPEAKGKEFYVNAFTFTKPIEKVVKNTVQVSSLFKKQIYEGQLLHFENALTKKERSFLLQEAEKHGYIPVGIDGYQKGDTIGSWRASVHSPELAQRLRWRLAPYFDNPRIFPENPATDTGNTRIWRPIGISPLFRYIRYTEGGLLVPHYDAPYAYNDAQRTLMSLVLYIDHQGVTGGETRFITDTQVNISFAERDFSDWKRHANEDEVLMEIHPEPGSAIAFDHRLLHDSLAIAGTGQKVIIRTDIVFARCS